MHVLEIYVPLLLLEMHIFPPDFKISVILKLHNKIKEIRSVIAKVFILQICNYNEHPYRNPTEFA